MLNEGKAPPLRRFQRLMDLDLIDSESIGSDECQLLEFILDHADKQASLKKVVFPKGGFADNFYNLFADSTRAYK